MGEKGSPNKLDYILLNLIYCDVKIRNVSYENYLIWLFFIFFRTLCRVVYEAMCCIVDLFFITLRCLSRPLRVRQKA